MNAGSPSGLIKNLYKLYCLYSDEDSTFTDLHLQTISFLLQERQSNSNIVMGKKRHFPATKTKNAKKASKVLKKIATKGKDQLKKAVKIQKIKEEAPKKTDQVNSNDKLQVVDLKPKKATDEKAVPKDEEDGREESGEASKVMLEKGDENDGGDDAGNNDSEVGTRW